VIKSKTLGWAGHVARLGKKKIYVEFCGETWGKETTRCKWEDNIKMNLHAMEWRT